MIHAWFGFAGINTIHFTNYGSKLFSEEIRTPIESEGHLFQMCRNPSRICNARVSISSHYTRYYYIMSLTMMIFHTKCDIELEKQNQLLIPMSVNVG